MRTYKVDIIKEGRFTFIKIPFNAKTEFNKPKGTIYVKGTLNGIAYRSKLVSKGNDMQIMMVGKILQKALKFNGKILSDVVMEIQTDDGNQEMRVDVPVSSDIGKVILENIYNRTSIRKFLKQDVEEQKINTILKAGFCAPSAKNKKPWHFIVIKAQESLQKLAKNNPNGHPISRANLCIAVCGDQCIQGMEEFLLEDCSAAAQNMLLAAHAIGLGAVWCGVQKKSLWSREVTDFLNLPVKVIPIALLAIGYPDERKEAMNRFDQNKVHSEKWGSTR